MHRTIVIAAALALAGLSSGVLAASAQLVETFVRAPVVARPTPLTNTGRPADLAFYADLTQGYDQGQQVHSNWDMNTDWLGVAYRRFNVRYDRRGMSLSASRERTGVSDYISSEMQRAGFFGYGRYEVVMQAARATGVVSSFFVYSGPDMRDPHDEIDFELLGRAPRQAHLNYFADGKKNPLDIDLWFDSTEGLHLYAFEWLPDSITWYADGVEIRRVTRDASPWPLPTTTGRVMASVWAANRQTLQWVGEPVFEKTTALYACMSHVPVGETGRQCSDTFKPPGRF